MCSHTHERKHTQIHMYIAYAHIYLIYIYVRINMHIDAETFIKDNVQSGAPCQRGEKGGGGGRGAARWHHQRESAPLRGRGAPTREGATAC